MRLQDLKKADASWKDKAVHARYRMESMGSLARLLRHGPGKMREIFRWDWLRTLAGASNLLEMAVYTRTGAYREASAYALSEVIGGIGDLIDAICASPDRVVIHEDLVPSEIFRAWALRRSWPR